LPASGIGYPDGRVVAVTLGTSVLEASRLARIPHASVCGGRGRCSTCRIRVRGEIHCLDPPVEDELRVLRRIGATSDVRLACQLWPRGAVEVTPLLPPLAHAADGRRRVDFAQGSEREIAIMFVDIRHFTALSEGRLPYASTAISRRWDERSKQQGAASTSSSATASWGCSGSSGAPRPAAGMRSQPPG
jgi:adenylate cyclase